MSKSFNSAFNGVSKGDFGPRSAGAINMQRASGPYAGAYAGSAHDQAYVTAGRSGGLAAPPRNG